MAALIALCSLMSLVCGVFYVVAGRNGSSPRVLLMKGVASFFSFATGICCSTRRL